MPKICYIPDRKFTTQTLQVIAIANTVLEDYQRQGYELTLRQLYYQLVAQDLFPDERKWSWINGKWKRDPNGTKNADPNYSWLGGIINDGRLAGLIDWDYLVDRTRNLKDLEHFDGAQDALTKLAGWYHIDFWERQKIRPEVWVEKDALVGVIQRICNELDVPYFSCRGYTSQSEMWRAGQRLKRNEEAGYTTHIIHLGDHDPSGVDMSRDIFDRLETFMGGTEVERIALNMDQVRKYDPPPNPAKLTDSRCKTYIQNFGKLSWELDALDPKTLTGLIRGAVTCLRDEDTYQNDIKRKRKVKNQLIKLATHWDLDVDRFKMMVDDPQRYYAEMHMTADALDQGFPLYHEMEQAAGGDWVKHADLPHPRLEDAVDGDLVRYEDIKHLLGE